RRLRSDPADVGRRAGSRGQKVRAAGQDVAGAWSHFSMGSPRSPGMLSGPGPSALSAITGPLAHRGLRVERGQQGLVGAGPEGWQQADLAGEGGPVVVDGVVLDEPVRDLHHVNPADFDLA